MSGQRLAEEETLTIRAFPGLKIGDELKINGLPVEIVMLEEDKAEARWVVGNRHERRKRASLA